MKGTCGIRKIQNVCTYILRKRESERMNVFKYKLNIFQNLWYLSSNNIQNEYKAVQTQRKKHNLHIKIKTDKMRDILKVVKETRQFFLKGVTTILKADFYYYINFLIFFKVFSCDSYFKLCLYNNGLKTWWKLCLYPVRWG